MKKNSLKVIAASLALVASQAQALNVGGVVWNPNAGLDFTTTDAMYETTVTQIGDLLSGYAVITSLNGTLQNTFCPGCELTYTFSNYQLSNILANGNYVFTGGVINVWVDSTPDWDPDSPASAADGNLWLQLTATTIYDPSAGATGTLFSTPTPTQQGVSGNGRGFLDVTGGLAAANFNTNTKSYSIDANGAQGFADFQFTSSFQLLENPTAPYLMFGSNDLQGNSIPEPGSLALIALGLIGLGAAARRRVK